MRGGITRRVLGTGAITGVIASLCAKTADAATAEHTIDTYMAPFVRANDFAGVIQVKRGSQLLARRSYGLAAPGRPNRLSSRFAIESVSKLITVGCLYRLQDSHALTFGDPLSHFLPDFPRASEITLAMLAQHMSGLGADFSNFETARQQPRTLEQLMPLVIAEGFASAPGQSQVYSNNGYRVLARVIELAGGASYHEVADRLVLRPMGLTNTGALFGAPVRDLSAGHVVGAAPGSLTAPLPVDFSNWQGAASFFSDAEDLTKFIAHYPFRALTEPPAATDKFGHDGLGHGYMAMAYRFPQSETTIVMLGNIESGLFQPLEADLEAIAFNRATQAPLLPTEISVSTEGLAPLVGRYTIGPGRPPMEIAVVEGRLAVNAGDGFSPLWRVGPSRFYSRQRYATLTFVSENGAVIRIDWSEAGNTFPCQRLRG